MNYKEFNQKVQKQFIKMCDTGKLFKVQVTGQQVWEMYLKSFEDEKVFRDPESSEHNCNSCHNFIKRYGNIVAINDEGNLESIFTNIGDVGEYTNSVKACDSLITASVIENVFFETYRELNENLNYESCNKIQGTYKLGIDRNFKQYTQEEVDKFGVVEINKVYEFHHLSVNLPKQFVDFSGESLEAIQARYRDKYSVFKRAMEEIPLDTLNLVRDLINQGSLLDGTAHLYAVEHFLLFKEIYNKNKHDNWLWHVTYEMNEPVAKFKNTLIGVLCTELAEGMELNKACENWNKRVDPINYHKATAPITQRQIQEAQKFVEENGYSESFNRRLATIDDIKADEILHLNVGDGSVKAASIFDNVKPTSTRHKRSEFDKLEEVGIEKFMKDVLPGCTSIEAYLENRMEGNLVILTKASRDDSKPIFKWDNNYSWTFNGNLAGKSQIRDAVKSRGGKIEGVVRVSMHFPDTTDDYDLHLVEPNGFEIYYGNRRKMSPCGGMLDLDAQGADGHQVAEKRVENIIYTDKSKMQRGKYVIFNNNYSRKGIHTKFKIEIEIEGDITTLELKNAIKHDDVEIAVIQFEDNNFTLTPSNHMVVIDSKTISKELWGLETNNFHKVNLVCLSPNHWGENKIGNLHYMFMLDSCKAETSIRSFHNENLNTELLNHRKVMEVLGATNMIQPNGIKYLAGLGFNSTVKDELVIKVGGSHKRMLKIKF